MPGQNISTSTPASINGLTAPVAGSYTDIRVLLGVSPISVSKVSGAFEDHTSIFPVGSIAAATGMVGIWIVALHEPRVTGPAMHFPLLAAYVINELEYHGQTLFDGL